VRKWTKSACMVIAWSILPIAMGVGSSGADHPAQATISIASSTQPTPADQPGTLMTSTAVQVAAGPAATWTVRPGDTLSAIAAALALPGGWQALYAANRRVVGPDPDLIRAGIILVTPGSAARTATAHKKAPASAGAGSGRQQAPPRVTTSHRKVRELPGSPGALTVSVRRTASAAVMPRWLKDTLLATGLLLVIAFTVEPALAIGRRRRRTARAAQERAAQESAAGDSAAQEFAAQEFAAQQLATQQRAVVKTARFVEAEHERLIVTYCAREDTVYLLTPPGEDPRAVLRAARLVLPEDTYEELAGHLGVPSGWPRE
jgi:LysM domain